MLRPSPNATAPFDPDISTSSLCSTASSATMSTRSNHTNGNANNNVLLSYYKDLINNDSVDSLPQNNNNGRTSQPSQNNNNVNDSMDISSSSLPDHHTPNTSSSVLLLKTPDLLTSPEHNNTTATCLSSSELSPLQFIDSPGRSKYHSGITDNLNSGTSNDYRFKSSSAFPNSFARAGSPHYIDSFIESGDDTELIDNSDILAQYDHQKITDTPDNLAEGSKKINNEDSVAVNNNKKSLNILTNNPSSYTASSISVPSSPTISSPNNLTNNISSSHNLRRFLFKKASFSKLVLSSSQPAQQHTVPTSTSSTKTHMDSVPPTNINPCMNNGIGESYLHSHSQSVLSTTLSKNLAVNNNTGGNVINNNNSSSNNSIAKLRNVRSLPQLRKLNSIINLSSSTNNNGTNKAAQSKSNLNNIGNNLHNNNPNIERQQQLQDSKVHEIETKELIDYTTFTKFTAVSCNKTNTVNNKNITPNAIAKNSKNASSSSISRHANIINPSNNDESSGVGQEEQYSGSSSSSIGSSSVTSLVLQHQYPPAPTNSPPPVPQSASMQIVHNIQPPESAGSACTTTTSVNSIHDNSHSNNNSHPSNNNSISSSGKNSTDGNNGSNQASSFARRLVKKASSSSLMRHITLTSSSASSQQYSSQSHNNGKASGTKKHPPMLQLSTSTATKISDGTYINSPTISVSSPANLSFSNACGVNIGGNVSSPVISVSGLRTPIDGSFNKIVAPSLSTNNNSNGNSMPIFSRSRNGSVRKDTSDFEDTKGNIQENEKEGEGSTYNDNDEVDSNSETSIIYEDDIDDTEQDIDSNSDVESIYSAGDLIYESDTTKELTKITQELQNAISQQIADNSAFEVTRARLEGSGWYSKEQLDEMSRRQNMVSQMWDKKVGALQERYQMLIALQESQKPSSAMFQRKSVNKKIPKKKKTDKKKNKNKKSAKLVEQVPVSNSPNKDDEEQHIAALINQQNENKHSRMISNQTKSTLSSSISEAKIIEGYNNNNTDNADDIDHDNNNSKISADVANASSSKNTNYLFLADQEDEEDLILRNRSATLVSSRTTHTYNNIRPDSNQNPDYKNNENFSDKVSGEVIGDEGHSSSCSYDRIITNEKFEQIDSANRSDQREEYVDPSERFEFEMS